MHNSLDSSTQKKLEELCRIVSVGHDLDPEIQEELHGHMEDKLLAYLNGEETVTEDDAFILVREHFGDPSALKGLLRSVHAKEANISLARRFAAGFAALIGISFCISLFFSLLNYVLLVAVGFAAVPVPTNHPEGTVQVAVKYMSYPFGAFFSSPTNSGAVDSLGIMYMLLTQCASIAVPILLWLVLRNWQKKLNGGRLLWFNQWSYRKIIYCLLLLSVLRHMVPHMEYNGTAVIGIPYIKMPSIMGINIVMSPLICMVWIWWCDNRPRRYPLICGMAMFIMSLFFDYSGNTWFPLVTPSESMLENAFIPAFNISWHPWNGAIQSLRYIPSLVVSALLAASFASITYVVAVKFKSMLNRPTQNV